MKVEEGKLITLEYTITTEKGELIESSAGRGAPLTFVFGAATGLPVALTQELSGLAENEEKDFVLTSDQVFGTADTWPTMPLPKNAFPEGEKIKVGCTFQAEMPGTKTTVKFIIQENLSDKVIVKLIPEHAGKTIHIKAKVLEIRDSGPAA